MRAALCVALAAMAWSAPIVVAYARTDAATPRLSATRLAAHVKGYYRKDGTYVRPHETRTPSGGTHAYKAPRAPRAPRSYSAPRARTYTPPAYGSPPRDARGRFVRSQSAKDEFRRNHPCPCTGSTTGPCPGYVIDHIKALKHGGADRPENMQWQTVAAAKAKDKWE